MQRVFNVFYNDGTYYGTMTFTDMPQSKVEALIQSEIDDNNKNINPLYHISRDNFKEETQHE